MIQPLKFIGLVFVFVAIVYQVAIDVPPGDPFAKHHGQQLAPLDRMPLPVFAKLKFRHIENQPRYDLGLFGNSRSLNVGARHLSLGTCRFFNYSVPSESFRFTVANLERLQKAGKAPKLALISLDHFELQRYNNPISFFAAVRWKNALNDLLAGLTRDDIGPWDLLRMVWRHALIETRRFKMVFNPETFSSGIGNVFSTNHTFRKVAPSQTGYHSDGSRSSSAPEEKMGLMTLVKPVSYQIRTGYFRFDLERLARIQKQGTQVVIYESPLEPKSAAIFQRRPSPQASQTRKTFERTCSKLVLRCYPSAGPLEGHADLWPNNTHPPAQVLSPYLNTLLDKNPLACRS